MSATKSGNNILVNGVGNTLASITSDIADTTFIEKTGTSPDVYTVKGNVTRYLYIQNGGELTIGDSTDYSVNETLAFSPNASNYNRFYVQAGGSLYQYGDTTIDFSTTAYVPSYTYLYGKILVSGNTTYKPVWQNYYRLYFYENSSTNTYVNDIWHFENMVVGSGFANGHYAFYFNQIGKWREHVFRNIIFDKSYGRGYYTYPIYIQYGGNGMSKVIFDSISFDDTGNYPFYLIGCKIHIKDCEFGTTTSWKINANRSIDIDVSDTYRSYGNNDDQPFGQNFTLVDGCTFTSDASTSNVLCTEGARLAFVDCEWQHTAGISVQADTQGRVFMWTGNTFTGGYEGYNVEYDGAIQWVHGLDVTVNDANDDPISGATVLIEQNEGKEKFIFETNDDGKLFAAFGLEKALLTNISQYGDYRYTNIEYWSSSANTTYHTITVMKDGYNSISENVVMDDEMSVNMVLHRKEARLASF